MAVLLMAMAFPGKASPGVLLPMLIVADIFAVIYYRRDCNWSILTQDFTNDCGRNFHIGYLVVDLIPFEVFEKVIGFIILAMVVMGLVLERYKQSFTGSGLWTYLVGVVAGVVTMIANAAGPVFGVFLLQMGLTKASFVGTRSWYFLLLNIFKVPFSANLGLITADTLNAQSDVHTGDFHWGFAWGEISKNDQPHCVHLANQNYRTGCGSAIDHVLSS